MVLLGAASIVGYLPMQPAVAQQGAQPAASSPGALEEIVITARKTTEKLQIAPVSVTAITAAKLDAQNVQSATALEGLVPNLTITQGSGYGTSLNVAIRSLIQADNNLMTDAPIAMYLNGVYNGRMMGGLFDLVDLEQVEVLRGPQGTLFGRNTTGGAINIVTRRPMDEFHVQQRIGYASDNEITMRTELDTGQIGNTGLKALLAFSHHSRDGIVKNTLVGDSDGPGSLDSNAVFFHLHGDLTDELTFDYRFDYTTEDDQGFASQITAMAPLQQAYFSASPNFGGAPLVISPTRLSTVSAYNALPPNHDELVGHSITVDYDANDYIHLKSITAYRSLADDSHADQTSSGRMLGPVLDFTNPAGGFVSTKYVNPFITVCPGNEPAYPSNNCDHQRQYQISEEFQLTGVYDEFKYAGGLYFFDEKVHEDDPEFFTIVTPYQYLGAFTPAFGFLPGAIAASPAAQALLAKSGGLIGVNDFSLDQNYFGEAKSFAAYGQNSYRPHFLDDKFEFTAGLRYSFDQKSIKIRDYVLGAPNSSRNFQNGAKNFHNLSWLLSMSYQFTPDIMGYWKIANAYKSGGFSPRSLGAAYNPEINTSYEFGVKSEFFDHRLRVNADVFYMKYENIQINEFLSGTGGAASVTVNAGDATYKGGELEFSVLPADGWLIEGAFGYTDPNFQRYEYVDPTTGQVRNVASQAQFGYASKMTYNVGVQYQFDPFSFGDLVVRADYSYASPRVFHPLLIMNPFNEIIKTSDFHNLTARVILKNVQTDYGTWEAKVYGTNLLDEDQRIAGIDFGGLGFGNNVYGRKRAIGFELTFDFTPHHEAAPVTHEMPAVQPPPALKPHSYMVFFDFNKATLTQEGQKIVDTAAQNAQSASVTRIEVTGHTDAVGSDAYNMRLSQRRAEAVAAVLEKKGVKRDEIAIFAKGKRDPLVPTADGVKEPQNRRVEIVYSDGSSPRS